MHALDLARWQFAVTTVYHFFFVPLTLGLALFLAIMETRYVQTGNEAYKRMVQFWGRLFLINFAMGVVTGIVQEFQFGMNWSAYSRYVGDIFGAPLAIEALLAFYLESTFLGIWMFGWDKLPKKVHLATIWAVAIGSNLSALWILIANSFMQNPVGYVVRNGRAELTDFFALLTNSNLFFQFPHVFFGGLTTAAFFVLGVSAYHLLRNKVTDLEIFQRSFKFAMVAALIGTVGVALIGHWQGQHLVTTQPMKMASAEALWDSEDPAAMSLFTIGDQGQKKDLFAIKVPDVLTILVYNNTHGKVMGIKDLEAQDVQKFGPGDYVPPVVLVYWTFRIMVGSGTLMALLALFGLYLVWKNRHEQSRRYLWILVPAMVLPYIANSTGWIMAEIGRQPWIVNGLLLTSNAVSPTVNAGSVLFSLIAYALVYGVLMGADLFLLWRYGWTLYVRKPATDSGSEANAEDIPLVEAY
jgi:cytochrome bd ubiquinol oxidase subunit I